MPAGVWQGWLGPVGVLIAGGVTSGFGLFVGRRFARGKTIFVLVCGLVAILAASANIPRLRVFAGPALGPTLSLLGGPGIVACVAALGVIGAAWGREKRTVSRRLLLVATVLPFLLLIPLSSGALIWRYSGKALYENIPDVQVRLKQTSAITCAPTAASMLLQRYGIRISEGEVAEGAGTSPVGGTFLYNLAWAIDRIVQKDKMKGCAGFLNEDDALRLHRPFVAYVFRPGIGGHAVLVERLDESEVRIVDPLEGEESRMSRAAFRQMWQEGMTVWIEPR